MMKANTLLCLSPLVLLLACSKEDPMEMQDPPDLAASPDLATPPDLSQPLDLAPRGDILVILRAIPGMTANEKDSPVAGHRFFQLEFDQPADHNQPEGQRFKQRATLLHKSYEAPVVFLLSGYGSGTWGRPGRTELTQLLSANQVEVEHRFFPPSRPEPPNWQHLTIEQSAADHHRLMQALRPHYDGRFATTGASKGGMTAVYHRRFYPDDVAASVPYVAPHSLGAPDDRYIPFVANAGDNAPCRMALRTFQRATLQRRTEMLARMRASGQTFDRLGMEVALEHAVLETPFGFWQYQTEAKCAAIPPAGASDADLYKFLNDVGQVGLYGDGAVNYFGPYYYQAASQLGFPGIEETHLADLLKHPGTDQPKAYLPVGVTATYDPKSMPAIGKWLSESGKNFLFIYGGNDPWTAGAFDLGGAKEAYKFVVKGGNHGAAIGQLPTAQKDMAVMLLGKWMGLTPKMMLQAEAEAKASGEAPYNPAQNERRLPASQNR